MHRNIVPSMMTEPQKQAPHGPPIQAMKQTTNKKTPQKRLECVGTENRLWYTTSPSK